MNKNIFTKLVLALACTLNIGYVPSVWLQRVTVGGKAVGATAVADVTKSLATTRTQLASAQAATTTAQQQLIAATGSSATQKAAASVAATQLASVQTQLTAAQQQLATAQATAAQATAGTQAALATVTQIRDQVKAATKLSDLQKSVLGETSTEAAQIAAAEAQAATAAQQAATDTQTLRDLLAQARANITLLVGAVKTLQAAVPPSALAPTPVGPTAPASTPQPDPVLASILKEYGGSSQ